ncbi:unnamed protein product, partial [Ilex paraguariensis]
MALADEAWYHGGEGDPECSLGIEALLEGHADRGESAEVEMTPGKGTGGEHVMTGAGDAPGIASLGTDLEQSSALGARSGQAVSGSGSWLLCEPGVVAVDARHGFLRVLEEDLPGIFGDDDSNQAMADVVLL